VTYHSLPALRALVRPRARPGRAAFGNAAGDAGREGGSKAGAAYATAEFGPEAAPIGAWIGGFVGGSVGGGISELFDPSAPCECMLGACNDDDDLDLAKYNILRSHADPKIAEIIDHMVVETMGPVRAQVGNVPGGADLANRIEICLKLELYAEAARQGLKLPPAAAPPPVTAKFNPDTCQGERDSRGLFTRYRAKNGECIFCPGGVGHDFTNSNDLKWFCLPVALPAPDAPRGDVPRLPRTPTQTAVASAVSVASVAGLAYSVWKFIPWKALI